MNQTHVKTEDRLRVVHDQDAIRIVDPDGTISGTIHVAPKGDDKPFRVQNWRSTRICHLLIAHKIIEDRKAAAGT